MMSKFSLAHDEFDKPDGLTAASGAYSARCGGAPQKRDAYSSPIIMIGMHRSGTTMVARLLQKMGLYIGWLLQENSEALFFLERNEKLMNVCGGAWDHPEPVNNLLRHRQMRALAKSRLLHDTQSLRAITYLGLGRFLRYRNLHRIDVPWGWKDPRNTYLLPLWLDVFPGAKIIHIYRHPMDVARSLQVREQRALNGRISRLSHAEERKPNVHPENAPANQESGWLKAYRKLGTLPDHLAGLGTYNKLYVPSSVSLLEGARLWSGYVGKSFELLASIANEAVHLKYEDFLDAPEMHLDQLAQFCGLRGDREAIKRLCQGIRSDRRYAFKADANARQTFVEFKDNEWVKRLGYDQV